MTKVASSIGKIVAFICAILCCALVLSACGTTKYKIDAQVIGNVGGTVIGANEYEEDSDVSLTATAASGYEFLGWFDSETATSAVSTANPYVFKATQDVTYYAKFAVAPTAVLDRLLNGAYNKYATFGKDNAANYFNASADIDLDLVGISLFEGDADTNLSMSVAGSLDFAGANSFINLSIINKDDNSTVLALNYVDSLEGAKLYVTNQEGNYVADMVSITSLFEKFSLPQESSTPWTIDSIISSIAGDNLVLNSFIRQLLSYNGMVGLFADSANSGNTASLTINLDVLLANVSTLLAGLDLGNMQAVVDVIDALTSQYEDSMLPRLALTVDLSFVTNNDVEILDSVNVNLVIDEDYRVDAGTIITIPESNNTISVQNISLGFASQALENNFNASSTTWEEINVANVQLAGDFNIYSGENGETLEHAYRIELNTDVNVDAILAGKTDIGFDIKNIDWANLGFVSLRIYPAESNTVDTNDYLNILYDSENSTQIYVYGTFVNGLVLNMGTEYPIFINNSYEINEFVAMLVDLIGGEEETAGDETQVASLAKANTPIATAINPIVVALLQNLVTNDLVNNNLSYDANKGIVLNINDEMTSQMLLTVAEFFGTPITIDLNSAFFGDNATQISIKLDSINYGQCNERNAENEMINPLTQISYKDELAADSNEAFPDVYNKLINSVISLNGLENLTEEDITALESVAGVVNYVDGTTGQSNFSIVESVINEITTSNGVKTANITFTLTTARVNTETGSLDSNCADYIYTLIGLFAPDINLKGNIFTFTVDVNLVDDAQVFNTKDMTDEQILAYFSDQVLQDVKNDTLNRSIVVLDSDILDTLPVDTQIQWSLIDAQGTVYGPNLGNISIYEDEDAPNSENRLFRMMIGWAEADFDQEWTYEIYYTNADSEKVMLSIGTITPTAADFVKTTVEA